MFFETTPELLSDERHSPLGDRLDEDVKYNVYQASVIAQREKQGMCSHVTHDNTHRSACTTYRD